MRRKTNRSAAWWSLCCALTISGGATVPAWCQTAAQLHQRADSLYAAGERAAAIPLYDRLLFFAPPARALAEVNLRLADSYYETGAFEQAARHYDAAYFAAGTDSLRTVVLLQKGLSYLLAQRPQEALAELLSLPATAPAYTQRSYLGLTYFLLADYDAAEATLAEVLTPAGQTAAGKVFSRARRTERRFRPDRAQWLSAFAPGLGQLYVGDVRSAANSAVINGAFAYLFVATVVNYNWSSALLTVLPWLQRYYVGGIKKVAVIAGQRGENRRRALYLELIDVLEADTTHRPAP